MKMLMCRPAGRRADGRTRRVPVVRERGRKYGPVHEEQILSIKKDVLISGANASGKTRWLAKLDEKGGEIWPDKERLHLRAMEPLQRWYEDPRIEAFVAAAGRTWAKLRAYEKCDALVAWAQKNKVVLILDDAHKLAGRKLDLAIQLARAAGILVTGTFAENSLPMSLRLLVDARQPQRINLTSEAAYDVTAMGIWLVIIVALGAGWWQLAAVMGGMKVLAGGRRAARQT
jgi:hypothetical protein